MQGRSQEVENPDGGKSISFYDKGENLRYQSAVLAPGLDTEEGAYEWFQALRAGGETESEARELNRYRTQYEYHADGRLKKQCEPVVADVYPDPLPCTEYTYTDNGQIDIPT